MPRTTSTQVVRWFFQKEPSHRQLETACLQVISVSARPYKCHYPSCNKTFKDKYECKRHGEHAHGPPKYQCSIPSCGKVFKWKNSLTYHLKYSHNFDESLRIPCPRCGKFLKGQKNLKSHIRTVHSDTRYKCPYPECTKSYKTKSKLYEHIRFVHQGLSPYVCEKCNEKYRHLEDLRNHLKRGLCGSSRPKNDRKKFRKKHDGTVKHLKKFLMTIKNPKSIEKEAVLPNRHVLDLYVRCQDNRVVGLDVTISRSSATNLRHAIIEKFSRGYEQFCDIVYIVAISKIKYAHRTIRKCDKSPLKPKKIRVIHWNAIIQDHPKYFPIFQQIEDNAIF